jgi:hypothetical protein
MHELWENRDRAARPQAWTFSEVEADEVVRTYLIGLGVAAALIIGGAGALAVIARMLM